MFLKKKEKSMWLGNLQQNILRITANNLKEETFDKTYKATYMKKL
jgi:hypothetical protein